MSERTERPTPQREREARRRGDVPRSRLLGAAAAALGAGLAACATWRPGAMALGAWAGSVLGLEERRLTPVQALAAGGWLVVRMSAPALAGALLGACLAGVALGGVHFDLTMLRPRMERLAPLRQLARCLTPAAMLEAARPLLLLVLIGAVAWGQVRSAAHETLASIAGDDGFVRVVLRAGRLGCTLAVLTATVGLADAYLSRVRHRARLRMTRQEVIDEHRQNEGDPRLRARRRALHRSLLLAGRARGVRRADVLVVNPTHLAVALRYAPIETDAPYLVAKGSGARAQALRQEAERWQVPVVRDVPLARSLIAYDVGEEIPEELYQAAAAILTVAAGQGGEPSPGGVV